MSLVVVACPNMATKFYVIQDKITFRVVRDENGDLRKFATKQQATDFLESIDAS